MPASANGPDKSTRILSTMGVLARLYRQACPAELGDKGQVMPALFTRWVQVQLADPTRPLMEVCEEAAQGIDQMTGEDLYEILQVNLHAMVQAAKPSIVLGGVPSTGVHRVTVVHLVRDTRGLHLVKTVGYAVPDQDQAPGTAPSYGMDETGYTIRQLQNALEQNLLTTADLSKEGEPPVLTPEEESQLLMPFLNTVRERVVEAAHPSVRPGFERIFSFLANLSVDPPPPPELSSADQDESHAATDGQPQGGFVT